MRFVHPSKPYISITVSKVGFLNNYLFLYNVCMTNITILCCLKVVVGSCQVSREFELYMWKAASAIGYMQCNPICMITRKQAYPFSFLFQVVNACTSTFPSLFKPQLDLPKELLYCCFLSGQCPLNVHWI